MRIILKMDEFLAARNRARRGALDQAVLEARREAELLEKGHGDPELTPARRNLIDLLLDEEFPESK